MNRPHKQDKWLQCDIEVFAETEKAFGCRVDGKVFWPPKSQMRFVAEVTQEYYKSPEAVQTVVMKEWIATKAGIEGSCEPYERLESQFDEGLLANDYDDDVPF